jgi:two-component system sensor histidine kinase HydH
MVPRPFVTIPSRRPLHIILAALTILLAVMLVLSAVRTYRSLNDQRAVFLRGRVATLAAHLETVPEEQWQRVLAEEEEALTGFTVLDRPSSPESLAPLWDGRELFRTESVKTVPPVFRAYIPFHSSGSLRVARIDIAESAADFLTEHAQHHLWLVALGGLLIVALTVLTVRSAEQLARGERRQMELQHLATLGEMSATLAHEIRNPLGTIKGFVQLLAEKLEGAHAPLLTPVLAETTRLEELVRDLLLYGRPALPSFQTVHSSKLEDIVRMHAPQAETAVAPLSIQTDPQLLEQVLLNLLRNAAEAVRDKADGTVRFELIGAAECAVLRVLDNGPGIPEKVRRRLFEPFYTTKASGTGLGLSVSKKLVESLGGHLTIEPRPSGGTVAEILLPLRRDA